MKKEGFVFLESVVVLVVVMLALTMLLLTYSLISRRTEEKGTYTYRVLSKLLRQRIAQEKKSA